MNVLHMVIDVICSVQGIHPSAVSPATRLGDVGDPLDLVVILCELEDRADIQIDDRDLDMIGTVGELAELIDAKRNTTAVASGPEASRANQEHAQ
jgi:acyl carrier protein